MMETFLKEGEKREDTKQRVNELGPSEVHASSWEHNMINNFQLFLPKIILNQN